MYLAEGFMDTTSETRLDDMDAESVKQAGDLAGLESLADYIDGIFGRTEINISNASLSLESGSENEPVGLRVNLPEIVISGEAVEASVDLDPRNSKTARRSAHIRGFGVSICEAATALNTMLLEAAPSETIEVLVSYTRDLTDNDFHYEFAADVRIPRLCLRLKPSDLAALGPLARELAAVGSEPDEAPSSAQESQTKLRSWTASCCSLDIYLAFENGCTLFSDSELFSRVFSRDPGRGFASRDVLVGPHLHIFGVGMNLQLASSEILMCWDDVGVEEWGPHSDRYSSLLSVVAPDRRAEYGDTGPTLVSLDQEFLFDGMHSAVRAKGAGDHRPRLSITIGMDSSGSALVIDCDPILFRLDPRMPSKLESLRQALVLWQPEVEARDGHDSDSFSSKSHGEQHVARRLIVTMSTSCFVSYLPASECRLGVVRGQADRLRLTFDGSEHDWTLAASSSSLVASLIDNCVDPGDKSLSRPFLEMSGDPGSAGFELRVVMTPERHEAEQDSTIIGASTSDGSPGVSSVSRSWVDLVPGSRSVGSGVEPIVTPQNTNDLLLSNTSDTQRRMSMQLTCAKVDFTNSFDCVQRLLLFWADLTKTQVASEANAEQPASPVLPFDLQVTISHGAFRMGFLEGETCYTGDIKHFDLSLSKSGFNAEFAEATALEAPNAIKDPHCANDDDQAAYFFLRVDSFSFGIGRSFQEVRCRISDFSAGFSAESRIIDDYRRIQAWCDIKQDGTDLPNVGFTAIALEISKASIRHRIAPIRIDCAIVLLDLRVKIKSELGPLDSCLAATAKLGNLHVLLRDDSPEEAASWRPTTATRCCSSEQYSNVPEHLLSHGFAKLALVNMIEVYMDLLNGVWQVCIIGYFFGRPIFSNGATQN